MPESKHSLLREIVPNKRTPSTHFKGLGQEDSNLNAGLLLFSLSSKQPPQFALSLTRISSWFSFFPLKICGFVEGPCLGLLLFCCLQNDFPCLHLAWQGFYWISSWLHFSSKFADLQQGPMRVFHFFTRLQSDLPSLHLAWRGRVDQSRWGETKYDSLRNIEDWALYYQASEILRYNLSSSHIRCFFRTIILWNILG